MAHEKPGARQVWDRLMPGSWRTRFAFLGKAALAAATVGGLMVGFAVPYGWPAVLRFSAAVVVVVAVFFSGFLHYRAWIAIGKEIQRADEATAKANNLEHGVLQVIKELPKMLDEHAWKTARQMLIVLKEPLEKGGLKLKVPPEDPPWPTEP